MTSIYNVARTHTINADTTYVNAFIRVNSGVTVDNVTFYPMIEEGTVATTYVPYNSLEFKVEGKNRFNGTLKSGLILASDGKTYVTNNNYVCSENYIEIEGSKTYTISNKGKLSGKYYVLEYDVNKNFIKSSNSSNSNSFSVTVSSNCKFIRVEIGSTANPPTIETLQDFQIEEGLTATEYEPYKSQVETFPLGEEKLMEGSYLADDGIHHTRKQYTFTGNETGWNYNSAQNAFWIRNREITNCKIQAHAKLCNYFPYTSENFGVAPVNTLYENSGATIPMFIFKVSTNVANSLETWKTWLQNHNLIVEYDLAEPETVPYTAEQQEAWNKIKNLTLFEGVNHISSNANMFLKYYPLKPVGLKFILRIDIENKQDTTELIDTTLPEVADYNKIYEEDVTAKVQVYIREDGSEYNLYLKTDRTTTTNKDDPDRASGKIEVISVETADRAEEEALNVMKGNNYKHLVEFKIAKTSKLMDITELHIGRPIRIKTDDDIYDSYISAITLSDENFVYFKSGSLRITLLDKLKKSNDSAGNKLDVSGGKITGNLNINGILKNNNKTILDLTYPIGSIYLSIKNTNPSSLFGGTWVPWGAGRVPVGVDTTQTEFNAVEKTGGEKTHTLTVDEMPSHNHAQSLSGTEIEDAGAFYDWSVEQTRRLYSGFDLATSTGGNQPHNNLQPYVTCYMWKRIS